MRNNTMVMLGASVAFGALAVILARGWISAAVESEFEAAPLPALVTQTALPRAPETLPVLVAAHDIAFGENLSPESFEVVQYPEDAVPMQTFEDPGELFSTLEPGEPLRALADIRALEPVFADRISGPGAKLSLSQRIREGYVATGVAVDPITGVGGHVVPGDLVDVMHITQPDPEDKPELFTTDILLQAVRVLGVDQNAAQSTEEASVARTVTLEVDRRDLQVLALGVETGTLALALRGLGETDYVTAPSLRSDQLTPARKSATPPPRTRKPAKTPDDGRTNVRVVRGEEVKSVRVRRSETVQTADASDSTTATTPANMGGYLVGGR